MKNDEKQPTVASPIEPVVSAAQAKSADIKSKLQQTLFDLMFHGCQKLTVNMADDILGAIGDGKIRGIEIKKDYLE